MYICIYVYHNARIKTQTPSNVDLIIFKNEYDSKRKSIE